ncbi:MAG: F0F1 ATP synthase subunit epsilon [Spirochaetota bacterium]
MMLTVSTPTDTIVERDVRKIIAEGVRGFFCLLPNHIDIVSPLKAHILSYDNAEGRTAYIAIDEGMLVKKGGDVSLSVRYAVRGTSKAEMERIVEDDLGKKALAERDVRDIIATLEGDISALIMGKR